MNSPSFYDPSAHPENSLQRRNQVLGSMLEQGKITQAEHDAAVATGVDLKITPGRQGCAAAVMAPYFCDYVSHLILNNPAYGAELKDRERLLYRGGLTIVTTLDSRLQAAAHPRWMPPPERTRTSGAPPWLLSSPGPAGSWPWHRTPCSCRRKGNSTPS